MSSLILYSKASYLGTSLPVTHGQTGELAGAAALDYLSVGVEAMNLFCWSAVSTASAIDYQLHEESLISASIADLSSLYPQGQTQYPMSYLGIDPAVAVPVWLDMSQVSGSTNAVASTSLVGGSTTSITTLSRAGDEGVLAFIGLAGGSAVVATCPYGSYDEATGLVDWAAGGTGTLVLEYTGGAVVSLSATGFPESWTFGAPKAQADGSWMIAVSGAVSGNVISDLSASKETLVNNGTDSVTLTATVTDSATGKPVSGVSVSWNTALGAITPAASTTNASGQATATLTDTGDTGATSVTASLSDGSFRDITITITDGAAGEKIVSLTADKSSIENDGSDAAKLTATVEDAGGNLMEGVTVYWSTTLGTLNHTQKDTAADGTAGAKLTDLGDTGTATVTASLNNGSSKSTPVTITQSASDLQIVSMRSDKRSMEAGDMSDYAYVYATVENGSGQPVSGVTVNWTSLTAEIQVMSHTSVTGANGEASVRIQPTGKSPAGAYYIQASLDNGSSKQIEIDLVGGALKMYCSTYAPLNIGAFASVMPTNKVAVYGSAGEVLQLSVTGSAVFKSSGTASATLTLGADGYGLAEVYSTALETVTVTATASGSRATGSMTFINTEGQYGVFVNNLTPADGRTPCGYYWFDYAGTGVSSSSVSVSGSAHFSDGTHSNTWNLNTSAVLTVSIYDTVVEMVAVTMNTSGYGTETVDVSFVQVQ
jgi:5-hydroxyisourate hydrolase-like protein (transthyretin family)